MVKFRHAVALALTLWYLMAPGYKDWVMFEKYTQGADYSGPIYSPVKDWDRIRAFDTAAKCRSARRSLVLKNGPEPGSVAETFAQFQARGAQCIRSDDPSLKGD